MSGVRRQHSWSLICLTKFVVISDFIKLIKTQDLARVFFAAGRKKKTTTKKQKCQRACAMA